MQNVVISYDDTLNKLIFLMKLSFIILALQLTFAGMLVAAPASSQDLSKVKVNLELKNAGIAESLLILQKKSGIKFSFYEQLLDKETKKVTLHSADISVSEALKSILNNTNLRYKPFNDFVVIEAKPVPQQPGRISGKIVDDKGENLPGASVKVLETGQSVQSTVDGGYNISLKPGNYTLEISYISFQTQRITGVTVTAGKNTALNVAMKIDAKGLKEVTVTSGYKKASAAGLLTRQKNASEMTNGISAEQIGRTPDKNIGESLKRISGVSTMDNKFVVVRGISDRYNAAVLDGTALPSTEAQGRNFSFDMIPSNLVDNVVVSKTVTPDMNTSFGGGLIQINTRDMPTENFMSFSVGTSYNDQTTGKPFFTHKRGKYDYLGFDDGGRSAPDNLLVTNPAVSGPGTIKGNETLSATEFQDRIDAQSRRFKNDHFTLYKVPAAAGQNYQFSLGRLLNLDTAKANNMGFTAALSYRNTQNNTIFKDYHRGKWANEYNNNGNSYSFNTTWGAILNVGVKLGKHRFSSRNTYTRMFDNDLVRTKGFTSDFTDEIAVRPPNIRENDNPIFTSLMQNKLIGQHQLGKVKLEWDAARTGINREEKAISTAEQGPELIDGQFVYLYAPGRYSEPRVAPMSNQYYENDERHYSWGMAGTLPFNIAGLRNTLKMGFYGNRKKGGFSWQIVPFVQSSNAINPDIRYIPVREMQKPENLRLDGYGYQMWFNDRYAGKSRNDAAYLMLDNRLGEKLRMVWGVRADYYKYTEISNPKLGGSMTTFVPKPDPAWRWLPSANLTYSITPEINFRTSWSISVVRPELNDNSSFYRYSPYLDGMIENAGLTSVKINNYDVRAEWFPSLGETFSITGFYKHFDRPIELTQYANANTFYLISNSEWAKVYGLEFELRKSLNFIAQKEWLNNLTLFGNATLQKSEVEAKYRPLDQAAEEIISRIKRPMTGQAPYLINVGLQYQASRFGFNVVYNKAGRKTYIVAPEARLIDYEMPRSQTDLQLSYKWLKNKMLVKLNAGNIFNKAAAFYKNSPDPLEFKKEGYKEGTSDKYEAGEQKTFTRNYGRTFSLQLNYNF
ncbi:TonB-dependent receptor [Pedobacter hiemivivus]|uniref:TonB-dependent receptor n=1 Tax=Pedobacter hiemivivus TaxID=2530454 RepID=A0A4R0MQ75_9SPHI|nr:TonB-dependent receptor [Pedobacter hiemivivus]TCC88990.1 hypothetical protein EZ444_21230 [Pedobacter hiemivivus]